MDPLDPVPPTKVLAVHSGAVHDVALDLLDMATAAERSGSAAGHDVAARLRFAAAELADRLDDLERELLATLS